MKISYAITVKDEINYIENLLDKLYKFKQEDDEIVVLHDYGINTSNLQDLVKSILFDKYVFTNKINRYAIHEFNNNFSEMKNKLNSLCSGDYIFNIDADELPTDALLLNIKDILNINQSVDLFYVPRVNIVDGITEEHIKKWKWIITDTKEYGRIINYPDYQGRIYKNTNKIYWIKPVHEILAGYETHAYIPNSTFDFCLIHHKDIKRQEFQNENYERIVKK